MSESNRTLEDSSLQLSGESRGEEADHHISNEISLLPKPLDLSNGKDAVGSVTNIYSYNRESQRRKKEERKLRRQFIRLTKPLQLSSVNVGIANQNIDAQAPRNEHVPPSDYIDDDVETHPTHKAADESNTYRGRLPLNYLIDRNCPKCKITVANAKVAIKQLCNKCETPLSYQCARCNKEYKNYQGLIYHLDAKCNPGNQNLKCPNCGYRSHLKYLMNIHLHHCLSGIIFSCGLCEYRTKSRKNLSKHVTIVHEDLLQFRCSECKTKPYKCEQCKTKVLICDTCRTGFSSNDGFQEHQKSCKQPVLACKYCLFETKVIKDLKRHIISKHLRA